MGRDSEFIYELAHPILSKKYKMDPEEPKLHTTCQNVHAYMGKKFDVYYMKFPNAGKKGYRYCSRPGAKGTYPFSSGDDELALRAKIRLVTKNCFRTSPQSSHHRVLLVNSI